MSYHLCGFNCYVSEHNIVPDYHQSYSNVTPVYTLIYGRYTYIITTDNHEEKYGPSHLAIINDLSKEDITFFTLKGIYINELNNNLFDKITNITINNEVFRSLEIDVAIIKEVMDWETVRVTYV